MTGTNYGGMYIRTDSDSVEAGTIRFEVENEGKLEHEFEVVKTDEAPGAFPVTDENKADVEAVGEELGEIPPIAGGASEELTLELEPGKLVFICNIPSHYKSGQRVGFTFAPTAVVLAGLYRRCYDAAIAGDGLARDSLLVRLLAAWYARCGERGGAEPLVRQARPQVCRAKEYLHANAHRDVSLAQLAAVSGLSPYHFLRVFTAELGISPHRYLTQLRVWRAARLLAHGRPISETALTVGFADQSHLTRHFKKIIGVTPGQYAQQVRS